jgi:hypothetical protein
VQSCFPSRDMVSIIDHIFYPTGAWDPLLPPLGLSGLESAFDFDIVFYISSISCACDSSLIDSACPNLNIHLHMEHG